MYAMWGLVTGVQTWAVPIPVCAVAPCFGSREDGAPTSPRLSRLPHPSPPVLLRKVFVLRQVVGDREPRRLRAGEDVAARPGRGRVDKRAQGEQPEAACAPTTPHQ